MNRIEINLATGRYAGRGSSIVLPSIVVVLGMGVAFYIGGVSKGLVQDIERVSGKVAELSRKNEGKPVTPQDAEREKASLASLAAIREQRGFSWIGALDNLEKAIPSNVSLASIHPSFKDGSVTLSGYAKDFSSLSKFINNLEGLKVYKRVLLMNHSLREVEEGKEAINFNISIEGEEK